MKISTSTKRCNLCYKTQDCKTSTVNCIVRLYADSGNNFAVRGWNQRHKQFLIYQHKPHGSSRKNI